MPQSPCLLPPRLPVYLQKAAAYPASLSYRPARKDPQPLAYSQRVAAHPLSCPKVCLGNPKASCVSQKNICPQMPAQELPKAHCSLLEMQPLIPASLACTLLRNAPPAPACPVRGETTHPTVPLLQTLCLLTAAHRHAHPSLLRKNTASACPHQCCRVPWWSSARTFLWMEQLRYMKPDGGCEGTRSPSS